MTDQSSRNGWNEWSKHILKELQRLNDGQDNIKKEIQDIKIDMNGVSAIKREIGELKDWKGKVTEIVSPTQLKEFLDKIKELEAHRIRSIAIFSFIQIVFGIIMVLASYFK